MKLALAIAVCVYLCAVIAVGQGKSDVGYLEFQRILAFVNGDPKYKDFPRSKMYYNIMRDNFFLISYERSESDNGINWGVSDRDWVIIQPNHDLYKIFLEDVDDKYTKFLECAIDPPFEEELMKTDLDFKLKCILAFRNAGDSSTRTTCGGISNIANDILEGQLGIFIKDLMDSVFDKDAKAKLEKISKKKKDFLGFFGLWFATDWEKDDMKTKIRNMKQEHRLSNNDKAAKIMVSLEIFDEGKNK